MQPVAGERGVHQDTLGAEPPGEIVAGIPVGQGRPGLSDDEHAGHDPGAVPRDRVGPGRDAPERGDQGSVMFEGQCELARRRLEQRVDGARVDRERPEPMAEQGQHIPEEHGVEQRVLPVQEAQGLDAADRQASQTHSPQHAGVLVAEGRQAAGAARSCREPAVPIGELSGRQARAARVLEHGAHGVVRRVALPVVAEGAGAAQPRVGARVQRHRGDPRALHRRREQRIVQRAQAADQPGPGAVHDPKLRRASAAPRRRAS